MANKEYSVSILLNVIGQGIDSAINLFSNLGKAVQNVSDDYDSLTKRLKELRGLPRGTAAAEIDEVSKKLGALINGSGKAANSVKDLDNALSTLKDIKIGGLESLQRLQQALVKLQKGENIKLNIDAETLIAETKELESNLTRLKKDAATQGDLGGFANISNVLASITDTRIEVERLLKTEKELSAKPIDIQVKLAQDFPKVKTAAKELVQEFEKAKELGLSVDFRSQGATEKINALLKELATLKKQAISIGGNPLKFEVETKKLLDLKEELKAVGARKDRIAREVISVKVDNLNQLKELDKEARTVLGDLEAAKRSGNIGLKVDIETKVGDIQKRVDQLRTPINQLGNETKIGFLEGIQNKLNVAKKGTAELTAENAKLAAEINTVERSNNTNLASLSSGIRKLKKDTETAFTDASLQIKPKLVVDSESLSKVVSQLENSTKPLDNKKFELLKGLKLDLDDVNVRLKQLDANGIEASKASQELGDNLARGFQKAKTGLSGLSKEFEQAKKIGASTNIAPKLEVKTTDFIKQLESALETAQKLGDRSKAKAIRLELANANEFKAQLKSVSLVEDFVTGKAITVKVTNTDSIKRIDKDVKELLRDVEEAKRLGNFSIKGDLEVRAGKVQKQIKDIEVATKGQIKEPQANTLASAQNKIDAAKVSINQLTEANTRLAAEEDIAGRIGVKSFQSLSLEARRLSEDIKKAIATGNRPIKPELEGKVSGLEEFVRKVQESGRVLEGKELSAFRNLAADVEIAKSKLNEFTHTAIQAGQATQEAEALLKKQFKDTSSELTTLISLLEKAKQAGISAKIAPTISGDVDKIIADLERVLAEEQKLGHNVAPIQLRLQDAKGFKAELSSNLQAVDQLANKGLDDAAKLSSGFDSARSSLKLLTNQFKQAREVGNSTKIAPQIEINLDVVTQQLNRLFTEAQKLGKDTHPIRVQLENAEKLKAQLHDETELLDRLAKKKILISATLDAGFDSVNTKIATLIREINEAQRKGDIRLTVKLQGNLDEARSELAKLKPLVDASNDKSKIKLFDKKSLDLDIAQKQITNLGNSTPGILTKISRGFKLLASDIGGTSGILRAFAGGLRVIGTSAFLVGGQFRTLGFAFTSFASILQNIAPLFIKLGSGLLEFGPAGAAILAGITALGTSALISFGKFTLLAAGIATVIEEGFKYNSLLEQTQNSIAALAQEFFSFSRSGVDVAAGLDAGEAALARFDAAGRLAKDALRILQGEALKTNFTSEQLFQSLQATSTALGRLSPGLRENAVLAGQFATVGKLAGTNIANLSTSITQVINGTGRATNRLQQLLNQTPDSSGILLTAERIRQLRAAGGTVLFNELSTALNTYAVAAKKAQEQSFQGVFSNFLDLFQQFSGAATEKAFETLRVGFLSIFRLLVEEKPLLDDFGNALQDSLGRPLTTVGFAKPLQDLKESLSGIISVLAKDAVGLGEALVGTISDIGKFLKDNLDTIIQIYEYIKLTLNGFILIASSISDIVTTTFSVFGNVKNTNTQLSGTLGLIKSISLVTTLVAEAIGFVNIGVTLIVAGFNKILLIGNNLEKRFISIAKILFPATAAILSGFLESEQAVIDESSKAAQEKIDNLLKDADDQYTALKKLRDDFRNIGKEPIFFGNDIARPEEPLKSKPNPPLDKLVKGDREKSILEAERALTSAILDQAKKREESELALIQQRLERQKQLIEDGLQQNLISQEAASRKIAAIKNKEVDNDIAVQKNQILRLNFERTQNEQDYQAEIRRIKENAVKEDPSGEKELKLRTDLQSAAIKYAAQKIKVNTEEQASVAAIAKLEESRLSIIRDQINAQIQRSLEVNKELQDSKLSIAQLKDANSAETFRLQILELSREKLDQIRKLKAEELDLQQRFFTAGAEGKADRDKLAAVQQLISNLQQEIDLKKQAATIDSASQIVDRQKNLLKFQEDDIQRQLNLGLISEQDATVKTTALRRKYNQELQVVVDLLNKIEQTGGINDEQKQKIEELKRSLVELGDAITENVLLKINNDVRDSFTTFFESIQSNVGNAKNAFADLGKSILATFQKVIAQKLVEELFKGILTPPEQTKGRAQGFFADLLRPVFGTKETKQETAANTLTAKLPSTLSASTQELIKQLQDTFSGVKNKTVDNIKTLSDVITDRVAPLQSALNSVIQSLTDAANRISTLNTKQVSEESQKILDAAGVNDITGIGKKFNFTSDSSSGRDDLDKLINIAANQNKLDPTLLTELLRKETSFLPAYINGASNSSGAIGLGQILASTGKQYGVTEDQLRHGVKDQSGKTIISPAEIGINTAAKILADNLKATNGNVERALAAYNGGLSQYDTKGHNFGSLEKKLDFFIKNVPQTRNYVKGIKEQYEDATGQSLSTAGSFAKDYDKFKQTPLPVKIQEIGIPGQPKNNAIQVVTPNGGIFSGGGGFTVAKDTLVGAPDQLKSVVTNVEEAGKKFNVTLKNADTGVETTINGLKEVFVKKDQELTSGQLLGKSGNDTGGIGTNLPTTGNVVADKVVQSNQQNSDTISSSVNTSAEKITNQIVSTDSTVKQVTISGDTALLPTISNYFNTLNTTIQTFIGAKLDAILQILPTIGGSSSNPLSGLSGGDGEGLSGLLNGFGGGEANGGLIKKYAFGGLNGFISGGAIKGDGTARSDSVPARLSNGEFVIQEPTVRRHGVDFFNFLNKTGKIPLKRAAGGALFTSSNRENYTAPTIDTSKYDYTGGGASLINKPDPIVEPPAVVKKKISGIRKFFGGLLSFVAPFLGLIPGIGPFLAVGAGALGGALSGNDLKSSLIGGILGGVGNLGSFAGSEGTLGKIGSFFNSGSGKFLTNTLQASAGNSGNQAGVAGGSILQILQKLKLFPTKGDNLGGLKEDKTLKDLMPHYADGGIAGFFSSIFGKLGSVFKGGSNSSGSSGGLGKLLTLFGISSALGGLFNHGSSSASAGSDYQEVQVDDPDAARKNRFGSAYNPLIDLGLLPGYKYSQDTLDKLIKQQNGFKILEKIKKPNAFFGFLKGLLPFLGLLAGSLKGGGNKGSIVDSDLLDFGGGINKDSFAANGGLISRFANGGHVSKEPDSLLKYLGGGHVKGAGTGTSDSIPAMLSNGEFVVRSSAVRNLGVNILDSINEGRFKFADGGIVGPGISTLPEAGAATNNINMSNKIINVLDNNLLGDYLSTKQGERLILNVISRNKKAFQQIVR